MEAMLQEVAERFLSVAPAGEASTIRLVRERNEILSVRQDVVQPAVTSEDAGAMVTVHSGGGAGYAATSDLSSEGLAKAAARALDWARRSAGRSVVDFRSVPREPVTAEYDSPVRRPWSSVPLAEKIDLLRRESGRLRTDSRIVDWEARLWHTEQETLLVRTDGTRVRQTFRILVPDLRATANEGPETQTRTFGGFRVGRQGGLEILDELGFRDAAPRIAQQALELLSAPDCPTGTMDLLLAPDQMILQIHESIGHPLELDRILGDERNYAGTSFVTPDMFGSYVYGSKLLNITFDPTRPEELASYAFDDEGTAARKEDVIREGILLRPLGGAVSQARSKLPGVANARASGWNRPPIDRMANLNLEPGDSTFEEMVAEVERGVYMESNCSWSIDDSRNKFQFGCEYARAIEGGRLGRVLRKPNYRGISATFWRSLKRVGNRETFRVLGTPYCGKGEPNQIIRVGHASPAALFSSVEVFGGAG